MPPLPPHPPLAPLAGLAPRAGDASEPRRDTGRAGAGHARVQFKGAVLVRPEPVGQRLHAPDADAGRLAVRHAAAAGA